MLAQPTPPPQQQQQQQQLLLMIITTMMVVVVVIMTNVGSGYHNSVVEDTSHVECDTGQVHPHILKHGSPFETLELLTP
jgi:hypothetical protein